MSRLLRNEGGFFSDYYLSELLRARHKGRLGENEVGAAFRRLSSRSERAFRTFGASTSVARTRQLWLFPLFEELHFSLIPCPDVYDDRAGEEKISSSHAFKPDKDKPVLVYVDLLGWSDDLDSPVAGHRRRDTPHRRMERLLDRGEARWGVVCNGKVIRLLRREQVSGGRRFFEVDLEMLFEEQDRDAFEVFWALFRADVFVPDGSGKCLLDLVMEGCEQFAVRVSEELRDSVRIALETFVRGMLRNECNREVLRDVDPHVLFEQGLIFMYRLLFVLYGESRGLLPIEDRVYRESYSFEALRDLIDDQRQQFRPNEYRLWKSLQALFRMIRGGIETEELVVPPYNGGLFSEKAGALLEKCRVSDDCMVEVLQTLSRTQPQKRLGRERIAYGELGVEELGAIYEGLLQYEPFVAKEEMAVVESKGEQIILPSRLAAGQEVVERIPVGSFYLSTWGGSRKQSGTYNTPLKITEWLVRQALEPLVKGKSSDEILELNVLDPAMGSGAFLVSACYFLADAYAAALVAEGKEVREHIDEEARAEYRRLVAERCIYGVDLNPLAVELAKVSLWLTTIAKGKPLTFLDQNLVCGDSLIGARLEDLGRYPWAAVGKVPKERVRVRLPSSQVSLYDVGTFGSSLVSLVKSFETLEEIRAETLEMIQRKAYLFEQDRKEGSFYAKCKQACDLWCALWFWPEGKEKPDESEYRELLKKIFNGSCNLSDDKVKAYFDIVKEIAEERHFLHWELEFPAIFFDIEGRKAHPGFDAVVGNPPWEVLMPMTQEFFSRYDANFRSYDKKKAIEVMEEILRDKTVATEWKDYCKRFETASKFVRNSGHFVNLEKGVVGVGGVLNTYKLFLEKFCELTKINGAFSIILPSGFHTDRGTKRLRRFLFDNFTIKGLFCFENRLRIFPIHRSFKFVLLSAVRSGSTKNILCSFMVHSLDQLKEATVTIPFELIKRFSPKNFSIMECTSQQDIDILNKCFKHPILGENTKKLWNFRLNTREFNMTLERSLFNTERKGNTLYEGKMIWHFNHRYEKANYWVETEIGRKDRLRKEIKMINSRDRNRFLNYLQKVNGAVYCLYDRQIESGDIGKKNISLHYEDFRVVIRSIASKTNERTLVSTIIPKDNFIGNSLFCVIPRFLDLDSALKKKENFRDCFKEHLSPSESMYLCALLNSFVVDYILRQKITTNLNSFFLYEIPIPRLSNGDWFFEQIVPRAARLICTTEEFSDMWREVYSPKWNMLSTKEGGTSLLDDWTQLTPLWKKECGVHDWNETKHDTGKRSQLRCEIDALVAHLYQLSKSELEHILTTFPIVKEKTPWLIEGTLREFDRLGQKWILKSKNSQSFQ